MQRLFLFLILQIMIALTGGTSSWGQLVTVEANGPDQMPLIYVHGFNDDGRTFPHEAGKYWKSLGISTHPDRPLSEQDDYYVVQWASTDMNPYSIAEQGWAVLQTEDRLLNGPNYNSTDPIGYLVENFGELTRIVDCPDFNPLNPGTWFNCESPAAKFLEELHDRRIRNNYNRNGLVSEHSKNLRDRLLADLAPGGQLQHTWQVNFLTHSAGGLDTRATLHRLNQSSSQFEREILANAFYIAPPFAGSTAAELGRQAYAFSPINPIMFTNPWFVNTLIDQTDLIEKLLRAWLTSGQATTAEQDLILQVIAFHINASLVAGGLTITGAEIASNPAKAAVAAATIEAGKKLLVDFMGMPGDPKMLVDLTPLGGVNHLQTYQENPHTRQFVIWGEQDNLARLNLAPPLALAASDYSTLIDFEHLSKVPGDFALANVSAQILSDFGGNNGYMKAVGGFNLNHGSIIADTAATGPVWANHLLTAVTSLKIAGNVFVVDPEARYYLLGGNASISFSFFQPQYNDEHGNTISTFAQNVQYRVVSYPGDGVAIHSDWSPLLARTAVITAADILALAGNNVGTEGLFRLDWRSVNPNGGRELYRYAFFRIDAAPPSVLKVEYFDIQDPDKKEIFERPRASFGMPSVRSSFLTEGQARPNLVEVMNSPETEVVLRKPTAKFLRIEFTEGGVVDYQWNQPTMPNPTAHPLVNNAFSLHLGDFLTPGLHTLYYRSRDGVGNTMATQRIGFLVDHQPPIVALNFASELPLGFVVGRNTPLHFEAHDVETLSTQGSLLVPGIPGGSVPVNSIFTMGDTNLADLAEPGLLATFVTLKANVTDAVGNTTVQDFEVLYRWSNPVMSVKFVGSVSGDVPAQQLASGNFRTSDEIVRVELTIDGKGAGIVPPEYHIGQPGTGYQLAGGPFEQLPPGTGLPAWGGDVPLINGLNVITFSCTDVLGHPATLTFAIERVDQLITFDEARPIELLSRRDPATPDDVSRSGSVAKVQVSDDGSVFVFESGRIDLLPVPISKTLDVYAWNNGSIVLASCNEDGVPGNDRSFAPGVSGNGRYVYFASEATNLTDDPVLEDHVNLYVKDIITGRIALINRDRHGEPANLASAFVGTVSYERLAATYSGRYLFFNDRFDDYVEGDTNGNHDIYCIDLDPDVNGDFFDSSPVVRRVSMGPGGVQGTGGLLSTGGSRRPSVSADGRHLAFDTNHLNLYPNNTNGGTRDAVLCIFAGVDAEGTIDFSSWLNVPVNRHTEGPNTGNLTTLEASHPFVERGGRRVMFVTAENMSSSDTNNPAVDNDVYESFETFGNPAQRLPIFAGGSSSGRIANNHHPSVAVLPLGSSIRSYVANKPTLTNPGRVGDPLNDLFVWSVPKGFERMNWVTPDVQTTQSVIDGGVSSDGRWAWWVSLEEYHGTIGSGGGFDLYRRRVDADVGGAVVGGEGQPLLSGVDRFIRRGEVYITSEAGQDQTFQVVLGSQPRAMVRAGIVSSNPAEGTAEPAVLEFNSSNWNTPQSFTITGQDDGVYDGDAEYFVQVKLASMDSLFNNVLAREISLVNIDNDDPPAIGFAVAAVDVGLSVTRVTLDVEMTGTETTLPVSFDFLTHDVTAEAGTDYAAAGGNVVIPPGVRLGRIGVDILRNEPITEPLVFEVELTGAQNAVLQGTIVSVTILPATEQEVWSVY